MREDIRKLPHADANEIAKKPENQENDEDQPEDSAKSSAAVSTVRIVSAATTE
jgi:hypothetical protein